MPKRSFEALRSALEHIFPERHFYVRSGGETKGYVLSSGKQFWLVVAVCLGLVWLTLSTGAIAILYFYKELGAEHQISMLQARTERLVADRQARLDDATREFSNRAGSLDQMAAMMEKRNGALIQILKDFKNVPGASTELAPSHIDHNLPAIERIFAVSADQERMVAKAENLAKSRAERLRIAFRMAGLNPGAFSGTSESSPLANTRDIHQLAGMLDVDDSFAERIHNAASDLNDMRHLQRASETIPFTRPTAGTHETSGFGIRFDPFTGHPKPHEGLDFAGPMYTPIYCTAPGIVSFAGQKNGFGNIVEVDHGNGFKTRYGHMASIAVQAGQKVTVGSRLGALGNTGRSTGPHLHYEVWVNGRPLNPARFIKAGDYVQ
jgi:murein DD-endopeptidase MepM/ murein hydrolase activator NlpD